MAKLDPEIKILAEKLKDYCGADDNRDWSAAREYWAQPERRNAQQNSIKSIDEYDGGEHLSISCTQTELSYNQQRKLVEQWCEKLPAFQHIKYLYFNSKVSQDLFESACKIKGLEALYISWSSISDLSYITQCKHLKYLYIGSFVKVENYEFIGLLKNLRWLQLGNVKNLSSLESFSSLKNLYGLGITGGESKKLIVDSLNPLSSLKKLEWLHLGGVKVQDQSLRALADLKKLKWMGLANYYPTEEFAWLSQYIDSTVCHWLQPFYRSHSSVFACRKCGKNWKVMCSGKGGRTLCPTCDPLKLARHVYKFNKAKLEVQNGENN